MEKLTNWGIGLLILGGLIVTVAGIVDRVSPMGRAEKPLDLLVTPTELVFDRVPFRGTAEKTLRFENVSNYVIQLNTAHWQCGCMSMNFSPAELQPGESKEFTVLMRGDSTPAALKGGELQIESTSVTNATIHIPVRATEVIGVMTIPETIDFGRPGYETLPQTLPLKIAVNGLTDAQVDTIKIESSHPAISCGLLQRNSAGDLLVDVVLSGQYVVGNILSTLKITGDGVDDLNVSVFAAIRHTLHAHPPTLMLQGAEPGEVVLRDDSGTQVPIESVVVSASLKEFVKCVPTDEQRCRIERRDSKTAPGQSKRGMIELLTKDKTGQMIAVSVPITLYGRSR